MLKVGMVPQVRRRGNSLQLTGTAVGSADLHVRNTVRSGLHTGLSIRVCLQVSFSDWTCMNDQAFRNENSNTWDHGTAKKKAFAVPHRCQIHRSIKEKYLC
jgi:hypothetical protein